MTASLDGVILRQKNSDGTRSRRVVSQEFFRVKDHGGRYEQVPKVEGWREGIDADGSPLVKEFGKDDQCASNGKAPRSADDDDRQEGSFIQPHQTPASKKESVKCSYAVNNINEKSHPVFSTQQSTSRTEDNPTGMSPTRPNLGRDLSSKTTQSQSVSIDKSGGVENDLLSDTPLHSPLSPDDPLHPPVIGKMRRISTVLRELESLNVKMREMQENALRDKNRIDVKDVIDEGASSLKVNSPGMEGDLNGKEESDNEGNLHINQQGIANHSSLLRAIDWRETDKKDGAPSHCESSTVARNVLDLIERTKKNEELAEESHGVGENEMKRQEQMQDGNGQSVEDLVGIRKDMKIQDSNAAEREDDGGEEGEGRRGGEGDTAADKQEMLRRMNESESDHTESDEDESETFVNNFEQYRAAIENQLMLRKNPKENFPETTEEKREKVVKKHYPTTKVNRVTAYESVSMKLTSKVNRVSRVSPYDTMTLPSKKSLQSDLMSRSLTLPVSHSLKTEEKTPYAKNLAEGRNVASVDARTVAPAAAKIVGQAEARILTPADAKDVAPDNARIAAPADAMIVVPGDAKIVAPETAKARLILSLPQKGGGGGYQKKYFTIR